jgi:formiminoglutamase
MRPNNTTIEFHEWSGAGCDHLKDFFTPRSGEKRIGEVLLTPSEADVVILGVEESVGPQANYGNPGAEHAFEAFCSKFLNMQVNGFVPNANIALLGRVHVQTMDTRSRQVVEQLDEFLGELLHSALQPHQVLVLIGGGHNNALPLIRWNARIAGGAVNVINLDPHADYRALEGRHSGNPFSYAFRDGVLKKYWVLGLHQAYNNGHTLTALESDGHVYTFFEDWLDNSDRMHRDFLAAYAELLASGRYYGVDVDLDAIAFMPSSAFSPSGITLESARKYVRMMAKNHNCRYLHLPEGAPMHSEQQLVVGKSLAYLVMDFISCHPFK